MANERQKQSKSYGNFSSDAASLSSFEDVKKLAEAGIDKDYLTYDELLFKMRRWWCQHYKRPYKDPLLDTYTLEELVFEYYDVTIDRSKSTAEVKAVEEVMDEDRTWAEEMEAEELAELEALARQEAEEAASQSDTIVEEDGLTDDEWAKRHTLVNPSPDEVDEGGDISASFGE